MSINNVFVKLKNEEGAYDLIFPFTKDTNVLDENGKNLKDVLTEFSNELSIKATDANLAPVASTGDYNSLKNKPVIPALNNTVTSTSTTESATANAVKTAYDKAVSAENIANSKAPMTTATNVKDGLMSATDKAKLNAVADGATNYVHPSTHQPSIIAQDANNRFVTDTEKTTWNNKATTTPATTSANGLMSSTDKVKLNGIAEGATNYVHPSTHQPSIITQDANNRFVTDTEKTTWNNKAENVLATTNANGLMSAGDKGKLNGIVDGANNYVHPSSHPATMITGLASVATSGSYNDLSNKPSLFNGDYNALSNKPAIPTSLPANGGNADTVDGKHASDFLLSISGCARLSWDGNRISIDNSGNNAAVNYADNADSASKLGGLSPDRFIQTTGGTMSGNLYVNATIRGNRVEGAVYNDYAEYRQSKMDLSAGVCIIESGSGLVAPSKKRLSKCPMIVSDTFGFSIGKQDVEDEYSLPIAVAGRVLAYIDKDRNKFKIGDVVCSGGNGTVSKMNFFEKILFPERVVGVVSEIPTYGTWGEESVPVNKRIWIKVK